MNLSSSLKTLTTKQYQLTAKQRLLVVTATGIMAILITVYVTTPEVAVKPTVPINNVQQPANTPSKPVILTGAQMIPVNQVDQIIRDPFARPPDGKEQKSDNDRGLPLTQHAISSTVPAMVPRRIAPSIPNLRLTGIAGTADQRLAVIMSANKSKSYSVNEVIGAYKLTSISNDSVILTNNDGNFVLRLEPAGQRGDNTSEK